jgi:hypothetical protein
VGHLVKRLSPVLGQYENGNLVYWCQGCKHAHSINVRQGTEHPSWTYDGNPEKPTFGPSVRHYYHNSEGKEVTTCHYFVKAGRIEYCGDCQHSLKGQKLDLLPLPSDEDYGYPS